MDKTLKGRLEHDLVVLKRTRRIRRFEMLPNSRKMRSLANLYDECLRGRHPEQSPEIVELMRVVLNERIRLENDCRRRFVMHKNMKRQIEYR